MNVLAGLLTFGRIINVWRDYYLLDGLLKIGRIINVWQDYYRLALYVSRGPIRETRTFQRTVHGRYVQSDFILFLRDFMWFSFGFRIVF